MSFKSGEIVRWIEDYAEGDIAKDSGVGIILSSRQISYQHFNHTTYEIYRNKHNDKMFFEERNITKLKGE
jgi:hypothetical protein